MSPSSDGPKVLSPSQKHSVQIAVDQLHDFKAGYLFIERLRDELGSEIDPHLDRFLESTLMLFLDGLYPPNRNEMGILPVLRMAGGNTIADQIERQLDRKVGKSTYTKLIRDFRSKWYAHPRFERKHMKGILEDFHANLQTKADRNAFGRANHLIKQRTASLYDWFKANYSEIVAFADSIS